MPYKRNGEMNRSGNSSGLKGFDEYSSSEMRDTMMGRPTAMSRGNEEFARCTIDSSSSHRSFISDNDSNEGDGKEYRKSSRRHMPESFRGTG
jgi:hypothetical protein